MIIKKFFGRKAENSNKTDCPECGGTMDVKDKHSQKMGGYYEIRRTYTCPKCGKEYGSAELIAAGNEIDSFLEAIYTLNKSMGDFYEALKELFAASQKANDSKNTAAANNIYSLN